MTPKQVPAELIELVKTASPPADRYSAEAWARTILAAALPAHRKQVREEVAQEIEVQRDTVLRGASAVANEVLRAHLTDVALRFGHLVALIRGDAS